MTIIPDLKKRMEGTISALQHDFSALRTGRASASMVDGVMVEIYGNMMPLNQVASVSIPEARMISISVWDKSAVQAVEKAIIAANLGFNPIVEGQNVRLPIPDLTEERRKELVKIAHQYSEKARIAIRNIRRDGMDIGKKKEKDGELSKDDIHRLNDEIQKLTDQFVGKIDDMLKHKEKDIMHV